MMRISGGQSVRAEALLPVLAMLAIGLALFAPHAEAQQTQRRGATIAGRVLEAETLAPIAVAEVRVEGTDLHALADSAGRYTLTGVPPGPRVLLVSALGYADARRPVTVPVSGALSVDIQLGVSPLNVEGIIVVADPSSRARGELGTASVVETEAIENQTAASLQGILELIPGQQLQPPDLASVQQISLRAVGTASTPSATLGGPGAQDLASFGTLIVLDGVPLSNNANLQTLGPRGEDAVPTSSGGGIDLRRIPASTLERVEVIRGVPSARYGDLTQGAIIVDTRAGAVAPTATARYDASTLEGSFLIGRDLGGPHAFTANADLTGSEDSPGILDDNTFRAAGQLSHRLRLGGTDPLSAGRGAIFDTRIDFFQVHEDNPERPEVLPGRASRTRDTGIRISERATLPVWSASSVDVTASLDYTRRNTFSQSLKVRGALPFTDRLTEGRQEGRFIGGEYLSRVDLEGEEWHLYGRSELAGSRDLLGLPHEVRTGFELRREWNAGPGYQFDIESPPQTSFNGVQGFDRPRSFDAVPAVATTALYFDDQILALLPGTIPLEIQAGLRLDLLHEGSTWFSAVRDAELQPRLTAQLTPLSRVRLRGAWGLTAKQPPIAQLYPPPQYYDIVNVNFFANDPAERLAVLTTFIRDPSNPDLGFSRGRKAEVGIELGFGGLRDPGVLSLVAFSDRTSDGVGFASAPDFLLRDRFQLTDSTTGDGVPPEIIEPPFATDTIPILLDRPANNLTLESEGLEATLDLPELRPLRTRLSVQGAWVRTEFFKEGLDFGRPFSDFQLDQNIPRAPFWEDPLRKGQLGLATYRLIHHQPELGLVITGTIQHTFKETEQNVAGTDTLSFEGYITRSGELVRVPPERRGDPEFEDLRVTRIGFFTDEFETPADWLASLQVSKTLPRGGRLSFYAFNVLDRRGRITSEGVRNLSRLRFGLEVQMPFAGPGYGR